MPKHRAVLYLLPSEKVIYRGEAIKSLSVGEGLVGTPKNSASSFLGNPTRSFRSKRDCLHPLKKKKRSP